MLEDRPILKDRLLAGGVFAGIAIAAVAGFELVVTGSLNLPSPGAAPQQRTERADYVTVVDSQWQPSGATTVTSTFQPTPFEDDGYTDAFAPGELVGGVDDATAPDGYEHTARLDRPEADIYRDIEHLDAQTSTYEERQYSEADDEVTFAEDVYEDEEGSLSEAEREKLNASGSASPS